MPPKKTRDMHVLFVHGVGQHSRLSALLQAYQSLRADRRSHEVPVAYENPIPEWRLKEFVDASGQGATPRLELDNDGGQRCILYEVNYSSLAGVVRGNHPLDLTRLFVGLDLAVNVARVRLEREPPRRGSTDGRLDIDHVALARTAQKLAGVLVAATVPILGIPSLAFRRFTQTRVALFIRFFEDVATFALDINGQALISAHFDRTVRSIVESDSFGHKLKDDERDQFFIAAHSLGSVVAHNYLVRHLSGKGSGHCPDKLLTFGSPIGLMCWLWLLIDFEAMDFARPNPDGYFAWQTVAASNTADAPLLWVNVLNHLDPIATAFPDEHMALARSLADNRRTLEGQRIHHCFIDTHDREGVAHTSYFDDREGFVKLLARMAGLLPGAPLQLPGLTDRTAAQHWQHARKRLGDFRQGCWAFGLLMIAGYLGLAAWLTGSPIAWLFLPVLCWPAGTIGVLAFFQRLTYSRPTKRTSIQAINALPWRDPSSKPHRMRQCWREWRSGPWPETREREFVMAPDVGGGPKLLLSAISFLPSLAIMLVPVLASLAATADPAAAVRQRLLDQPLLIGAGALALFTVYSMAFAVSEFALHWRAIIEASTAPETGAADGPLVVSCPDTSLAKPDG